MNFDEAIQLGLKKLDAIYQRMRSNLELEKLTVNDLEMMQDSMNDTISSIKSIQTNKKAAGQWAYNDKRNN